MGDFKIPIKISILLVSVLLSGSTVQAQSSVIDKSDPPLQVLSSSYSRPDSTGYANNTIELTINSAFPVSVTIDGTMQGSDVSNFELSAGQHTFSVPEIVQLRAGTRLKFQKWTDGVTAPNRTEYLTGDATFTAIYVLQYSLVLVSPEANVTGTGWYDEGTSASLSAPPTAPMGGIRVDRGEVDFSRMVRRGCVSVVVKSVFPTYDQTTQVPCHLDSRLYVGRFSVRSWPYGYTLRNLCLPASNW